MRQDLRQRQRQIRKLHDSIQKYQQSPNTKKAVEQATLELANAIQYKYRKSQANAKYIFPRIQDVSDDEYDDQPQIFDLKASTDFLSQQLSIAQQAQSNFVYISEKTVLTQQRYSPFSKQNLDQKSKLKIKVFKKKNYQTCESISKLDRLKTEHIQANFSTISYKNDEKDYSKNHQNESSASKSRILQPSSEANRIRKKLKIACRVDSNHLSPPTHANLTMKTEYSHCVKRKLGKQNERNIHQAFQNQKHYVSHNSTKKLQPNSTMKTYLNIKLPVKKIKEAENQKVLQINKKNRMTYKSFESLKSIRLGNNKSTEKIKLAKALHA